LRTLSGKQGLQPFEGHELATGETSTRGLETLANFAAESAKAGARFAKWRAVLRIDESKGYPSERAVQLNAEQLADYAVVCQAAGLVPIVEPEILIEGPHSAAMFGGVTECVIGATVAQMWQKGVQLEGCLLKPQMVIPVSLFFRPLLFHQK
jgi:fructose-bisphosphate aldolase class I